MTAVEEPGQAPTAPARARFRFLVHSDLRRYREVDEFSWTRVAILCTTLPGMLASVLLRAQQCLHESGHDRLARLMRPIASVLVGADFAPGATIGTGLLLAHPVGVALGPPTVVGNDVSFAGGVTATARTDEDGSIVGAVIGDGVVLGAHVVVAGGVHVGENAMAGSNSFVMSDVPADAVVFGVPAKQVGTRTPSTST